MKNYLLTAALTFSGMLFSAYGSNNMFEDMLSKENFEAVSKKMDGLLKGWSVEDVRKIFTSPTIMRDLGSFSVVNPKEFDRFIAFLKEHDLFGKELKDAFNKAWEVLDNDLDALDKALEDMNKKARVGTSAGSEERKRLKIRVETLDRIASDNAACLDGCRILGKDVADSVGSPERLGKFIARAMIADANSYVRTAFIPSRTLLSAQHSLNVMHRDLLSFGRFDIDRFVEIAQKLKDDSIASRKTIQQFGGHNPFSGLGVIVTRLDESYNFRAERMERLFKNAKTYKKALNSKTGFVLKAFAKQGGKLDTCGIAIKKLLGGLIAVGAGEFFVAERVSAASLDDFDVEVSPEEYDVFYSAVEMERDRLLAHLKNSD